MAWLAGLKYRRAVLQFQNLTATCHRFIACYIFMTLMQVYVQNRFVYIAAYLPDEGMHCASSVHKALYIHAAWEV